MLNLLMGLFRYSAYFVVIGEAYINLHFQMAIVLHTNLVKNFVVKYDSVIELRQRAINTQMGNFVVQDKPTVLNKFTKSPLFGNFDSTL